MDSWKAAAARRLVPRRRSTLRSRLGFAGLGLLLVAGALVALALAYDGLTDFFEDTTPPSVQGVILSVDASSLTSVDSFTLRSNEGEVLVFEIAPDAARDPREGFVAGHLRSHAVLAQQVKVFYREEGGEFLAVRLEDR